jgi:CDP-paratose 2-epimerase
MMKALITGGAGFIGCNTVKRLAGEGWEVTVLDNLSRKGSEKNLDWLRQQVPFDFVNADIRDVKALGQTIRNGRFDVVIHLAAQVAVTTSVIFPRDDFEANALGTFNVLEAIRCYSAETILLNASTNKVYGHLDDITVRETGKRYEFVDYPQGVAETRFLDFHSPYGCSKGAADQYVRDYARIYGLRSVNFRQSCIYGYRQFGVEDQGWVAWFIIAHVLGKPIMIYGNGRQVRDILFVDDLIDLYELAIANINSVVGQTFNIGGGVGNTMSLLEFVDLLESFSGRKVNYSFSDWRPGDQPLYISDLRKAETFLNWRPRIPVQEGIEKLYDWVSRNTLLFD